MTMQNLKIKFKKTIQRGIKKENKEVHLKSILTLKGKK